VGKDVFEAVLEHISFEQAKNFCDSNLGNFCVGECGNVLFSLANREDSMEAPVAILSTTA
jgi:hypothetical protein